MPDWIHVTSEVMSSPVILVVEDEMLIRTVLADTLRDEGYQVVEAVTGDQALDVLSSGQTVHLILTDVRMPGKTDGLALASYAKRTNPLRPVIIMSAHLAANDAALANNFFSKPYVLSLLLNAVEKLIGQPQSPL